MPIPKKKASDAPGEEWLTTYADAITLLMAFFVMLLTFAEFDVPAYEEAAAAIKDNIGHGEKEQTATQTLKLDIEDVVRPLTNPIIFWWGLLFRAFERCVGRFAGISGSPV